MKILSGVYNRDTGKVEVFGKEYGDFTPKQAQQAGGAIIHQELNMCRHLSVAENMFLGREKSGRYSYLGSAGKTFEKRNCSGDPCSEYGRCIVTGRPCRQDRSEDAGDRICEKRFWNASEKYSMENNL